MPKVDYFKGHGKEVMADMHKRYGSRAEEVFYRTANKRGMEPKSHMIGSLKGLWGDIGAKRQEEAKAVGGFGAPTVRSQF